MRSELQHEIMRGRDTAVATCWSVTGDATWVLQMEHIKRWSLFLFWYTGWASCHFIFSHRILPAQHICVGWSNRNLRCCGRILQFDRPRISHCRQMYITPHWDLLWSQPSGCRQGGLPWNCISPKFFHVLIHFVHQELLDMLQKVLLCNVRSGSAGSKIWILNLRL